MLQRTLVLLKPDAVQRNLIGKIIKRYEDKGLKVAELRMMRAPLKIIEKHYPEDEEYLRLIGEKSVEAGENVEDPVQMGKMVVSWLRKFITSGPVVAMVLEGEDAVARVRKLPVLQILPALIKVPSEVIWGRIRFLRLMPKKGLYGI